MRQVFIVGSGKFGKIAWKAWRDRYPRSRIWLIDSRPEALSTINDADGFLFRLLGDGPKFLFEFQDVIRDGDWVVPALPIHLAWEWLWWNVKKSEMRSVSPPPLGQGLPFQQRYGRGLYLSYADFLCPERCPAPSGYCFKTREKRPIPLWRYLSRQKLESGSLEVIESRQVAPGVGGYPFRELRRILRKVREGSSPFYLATACRCHGVVHGLEWR